MFSKLDNKTHKLISVAESTALDMNSGIVGTEHLLLAILRMKNCKLRKILENYFINYKVIHEKIIESRGQQNVKPFCLEYSKNMKKVIEYSTTLLKNKNEKVTVDLLSISLLTTKETSAYKIFTKYKVDIENELAFLTTIVDTLNKTNELDNIQELVNINSLVQKNNDYIMCREKETLELMECLLRKQKPNALIIGEPGVGKTSLVYHLAHLINEGKVVDKLKNKVIYELNIASLVAGTRYRGEFEEKLNNIIRKVKDDKNIINFIDEIHNIIGAGKAEGTLDAASILKPYLSNDNLQIIGATTFDEYVKIFEKDKALNRRFHVINVSELHENSTKIVLTSLVNLYKKHYKLKFNPNLIDIIITYCKQYIPNRFFPDKGIDILDLSFSKAKINNKDEVGEDDVVNVIEQFAKVKITKESKVEKLKKSLDDNIIGQYIANKQIVNQISCIEKGLVDANKPLGVFMFVGPTGVGKTETAKIIAETYFGSSDKLIKIDMSQFMESCSVSKLIGSAPGYVGYNEQTYLIDEIRKKPHSVILLDEIEKAHKDVLNVFLNVFDEGYLIDSNKRRIDFTNCIIILTSNLGYSDLKERNKLLDYEVNHYNDCDSYSAVRRHFTPEFLNRIDEIIQFNPLDNHTNLILANRYIQEYLDNIKMNIEISDEQISNALYSDDVLKYGARGVKRIVKKLIIEAINFDSEGLA